MHDAVRQGRGTGAADELEVKAGAAIKSSPTGQVLPAFPELRRYEAAWGLVRWHDAACGSPRYRGTSTAGDVFLPNLPEAARLLGLPFAFRPIPDAG